MSIANDPLPGEMEIKPLPKKRSVRTILLLLAVLTSPLGCCLLSFLPNIFGAEARVKNVSGETLYLTAVTTTTGRPVVIGQRNSLTQRDILIRPNQSRVLQYDSADMPLAGIAVCRTASNCRLLAADHYDTCYINCFECLPPLEPDWSPAIQSYPRYNFYVVLLPLLGFVPVVLFLVWGYLVLQLRFGRHPEA